MRRTPMAPVLLLSVGLVTAVTPSAIAQRPVSAALETQRGAIARLDYMVGEWTGEGWIVMGPQRLTFTGGERVQRKLEGVALLVEGSFFARPQGADRDVPVHTTLGVISYDPRRQQYRFHSWLATGASGEHELVVDAEGKGWKWEVTSEQGVVRYVTSFTEAGEWIETGERSRDRRSWEKFFEMRLRKQS